MAEQGKGARGRLEPIPQIKPYEPFAYNAFDLPDPFKPRKIERRILDFIQSELLGPGERLGRDDELLTGGLLDSIGAVRLASFVGVLRRPDPTAPAPWITSLYLTSNELDAPPADRRGPAELHHAG